MRTAIASTTRPMSIAHVLLALWLGSSASAQDRDPRVVLAMPSSTRERARPEAESRDVWSDPNPGVRYLHRTTSTPCEIHALLVDLRHPGVRIAATPYRDRWASVSEHARARGAAAAINGGFYTKTARPMGLAAGGGVMWPSAAHDPAMGFFAIDRRGRPLLHAPEDSLDDRTLASIAEAVSGRPILVRDGEIDLLALDSFETSNQRQPRTAIGLDASGHTAILVVVDSRRRASRGMTLYELSRLMIELGAADALNLDGGGSSEMFVARAGGVVNVPSGGRWEVALDRVLGEGEIARRIGDREEIFARGIEREVINHLSVHAPEPAAIAPVAHPSELGGLAPIDPPPPRPPRVRLGVAREWIADAIAWMVPVLALVLIGAIARRRRRCSRSR